MNALGLKLHPTHCNCGKCSPCPASNSGVTIETLQRTDVGSTELGELAERWERRIGKHGKIWKLYTTRDAALIQGAVRLCIDELRAGAESSPNGRTELPLAEGER